MGEVPESLKQRNSELYGLASSADPSIACQYIGKLITSLMTTMKYAEVTEYDRKLRYEMLGARRAWFEYSEERNPGKAMQTVNAVLTEIEELLFNEQFATTQSRAFHGRQ